MESKIKYLIDHLAPALFETFSHLDRVISKYLHLVNKQSVVGDKLSYERLTTVPYERNVPLTQNRIAFFTNCTLRYAI